MKTVILVRHGKSSLGNKCFEGTGPLMKRGIKDVK